MFKFLKRREPEGIEAVVLYLQRLGYELLPSGTAVATEQLQRGFSPAEAASRIAYTTLARDVKEAGDDILDLLAFVPHGEAMMAVLGTFKSRKLISAKECNYCANAIRHVIVIDEKHLEWMNGILSSPSLGAERLAVSQIKYGVTDDDA